MIMKADKQRAVTRRIRRIDELLTTRRCVSCGDLLGASNPVAFVVSDLGVGRKGECQDLILQLTVGELAEAGDDGATPERDATPKPANNL